MFNDLLTVDHPEQGENGIRRSESRDTLVVVLGMHRSGTSLVTHILKEAGFFVGETADLIHANSWNAKGYFERRSVMFANEKILEKAGGNWFLPPELEDISGVKPGPELEEIMRSYQGRDRCVLKDPRLCLTFPLWRNAMKGRRLRIVRVIRHPEAVAASLARRDGFSKDRGLYLWKVYNDAADKHSYGLPVLNVSYEALFTKNRRLVLSALMDFLDIREDLEPVADRIVDPNLKHQDSTPYTPDLELPANLDAVAKYEQAHRWIHAGNTAKAIERLEDLVALYPKHILGCNDLGVLYHCHGRLEEAFFCFRRARALAPENEIILGNLRGLETAVQVQEDEKRKNQIIASQKEKEQSTHRPWWDYPRFSGSALNVLLLGTKHLLLTEISGALERTGHQYQCLMIENAVMDRGQVEGVLKEAVSRFKPDFLLTVNHSGFDNEGVMAGLLSKYRLPFASWYVDSPYLILQHYAENRSPYLSVFLWDSDYMEVVRSLGIENVDYLPLGTDDRVFRPIGNQGGITPSLQSDTVGFVGNSMVLKSGLKLERSGVRGDLLRAYPVVCAAFENSDYLTVCNLLEHRYPDLYQKFIALPEMSMVDYETSVIWNATGRYRLALIRQLESFHPVIVGDSGWKHLLGASYRIHKELNYYSGLTPFYNAMAVNFNATSRQMKQGVNQRVFDIPACGSIVVTDRTRQLEQLMDPGEEILAYRSADDLPGIIERAVADEELRNRVANAGYQRVLSKHLYVHRIRSLIRIMRKRYE